MYYCLTYMLVVYSSIVKHVWLMTGEPLDLQTADFASMLVMDIHMLV